MSVAIVLGIFSTIALAANNTTSEDNIPSETSTDVELSANKINKVKTNDKEKAEQLNSLASETNNMYLRQFDNNAGNIKNKTFRNATLNLSALGGPLDSFTKSRLLSKSFNGTIK